MTDAPPAPTPSLTATWSEVFTSSADNAIYIELPGTRSAVTYFVGRNGSGKSRTARALADKSKGHFLSTDRLTGLMQFSSYEFGAVSTDYRGIPVASADEEWWLGLSRQAGTATQEMHVLRERPDVALRVAAFIRRALGRSIELRESAGFLDPVVRTGGVEYSLLREEGHGLRELVVLLAALYRDDWSMLVIDEPELHLHPSMVRLWAAELSRECEATGREALIVTHEPSLLKPKSYDDLASIWLFQSGQSPRCMADAVLPAQRDRVTASLAGNPSLVGALAFAPRPVLVEGRTDVAALTVALRRTRPHEVAAQTELVECGGSGGVSMWLEISHKLGLDVRAVADLDACFTQEVQRVMDADPEVTSSYQAVFYADPPKTHVVVKPLITAADADSVSSDPKSRAGWLATVGGVHGSRRDTLLRTWAAAGLWLHPQGTLEHVLGLSEKGAELAAAAAENAGPIDDVARWCGYELDTSGDVELLLNVAVEGVAHRIMEAQRSAPATAFHAPPSGSVGMEHLVTVEPAGQGAHRITVLRPREYENYFVEFTRETPSTEIILREPSDPE